MHSSLTDNWYPASVCANKILMWKEMDENGMYEAEGMDRFQMSTSSVEQFMDFLQAHVRYIQFPFLTRK